jgi:outer membrane protein
MKMKVNRSRVGRVLTVLAFVAIMPGLSVAQTKDFLTLEESVELALKQSVLIHAAEEGVLAAEALKKEAFTGFLPKLSTAYNYTRLNSEPYTTIYPLPSLTANPSRLVVGTQDNYTWASEVRQPLFAGGGILANYQMSRLGHDISLMEKAATVQDIIREVKIAYFNILKAEKLLEVARQSVTQLESHLNVARNFFEVGLIPRNDLLQSEVSLANGELSLSRAENGLELARARFNTVLRRDINAPVRIEDILAYRPYERTLEQSIATALENRPEIRSQALKVDQAKSQVKLARSDYFPTIHAVGHYERVGDRPGVTGSDFKDAESWYVMGQASWTFWEWGKTKNRVDAVRSRENQSQDLLANLKDQVMLEVKDAYLLLKEAEKQIKVTQKTIEQAHENHRINEERYREQVATSTEVLDALTLLTRARSDHATALGNYSIDRARLERAMGEIEAKP